MIGAALAIAIITYRVIRTARFDAGFILIFANANMELDEVEIDDCVSNGFENTFLYNGPTETSLQGGVRFSGTGT